MPSFEPQVANTPKRLPTQVSKRVFFMKVVILKKVFLIVDFVKEAHLSKSQKK